MPAHATSEATAIPSSFAVTFLSALQAAASVLVTIGVGVAAAQFDLATPESAKHISQLCVNISLPSLLIANLGSELHIETAPRYIPILIWATLYCTIAIFVARAVAVLFNLPRWTVATVVFNNTTSLPLFLIQSLDSTGALRCIVGEGKGSMEKLRSYFLVYAVVNNIFTFGTGKPAEQGFSEDGFPYSNLQRLRERALKMCGRGLMNSNDEEAHGDGEDPGENSEHSRRAVNSESGSPSYLNGEDFDGETTPLLPQNFIRWERSTKQRVSERASKLIEPLPEPVKKLLRVAQSFVTPTAIGALLGAIIGLVPALHRLFFSPMQEGGYFNAWLTIDLRNVGELFVTLQVIVVGVELSLSLQSMKKGENSGDVPWGAAVYVIVTRFIVMPLLSIPIVWALACYTNLLPSDRAVWFAMMILPVGPPAMKLIALADVSHIQEKTRMSIAKLLTFAYAVTPLISLAVVGALKATEAVHR